MGRHVAPPEHIMLILSQPVFHQNFLIITLLQVLFPAEYTTIETEHESWKTRHETSHL